MQSQQPLSPEELARYMEHMRMMDAIDEGREEREEREQQERERRIRMHDERMSAYDYDFGSDQ